MIVVLIGVATTLLLGADSPGSRDGVAPQMRCLKAAYPAAICELSGDAITLCEGTRLRWSDDRPGKAHDALIAAPSLQEMMSQRYRLGRATGSPALNHEPGRIRHTPFFEALYGATEAAVRADLVRVPWLLEDGGRRVLMSRRHGAAAALEEVARAIEAELPRALRRIAADTSGTFNWRRVRGTRRRSMHSFGIAIDLGVRSKVADYWDWNRPDAKGRYRYKNRFPAEIVEIFERHGFVWGGKWYHFDTMHFEYRPELLVAPCVIAASE